MGCTFGNRTTKWNVFIRGVMLLIFLCSSTFSYQPTQAIPTTNFVVDTDSDFHDINVEIPSCDSGDGKCGLRAAIEQLEHDQTGGIISFDHDYTINIIYGNINIYSSGITITGGEHAVTLVGTEPYGLIFRLLGNGGQIDHLTLSNPNRTCVSIEDYLEGDPTYLGSNYVIDHVTFLNCNYGVNIITDETTGTTAANNTIRNSLFGTTLPNPTSCNPTEKNQRNIYLGFTHDTLIEKNQIVCSSDYGIFVSGGSNTTITGNTISGNATYGLYVELTDTMSITGNYIGNQSGTAAFPNGSDGLFMSATKGTITIGGTNPADRNIISGNNGNGILLDRIAVTPVHNVTIDGNSIGLDADHNPMPNLRGIILYDVNQITIGSDDHTAVQQYISGNTYEGIDINGATYIDILDSTMIGIANWTDDSSPTTAAGNGRSGIWLEDSVHYVNVESWMIANNAWRGITTNPTVTSMHNRFLQKNAHSNGSITIDLGNDNLTVNDEGDSDNGPNDLLNYPVITSVNGSELTGTACANCQVYFYQAVGNPGANGGGGRYSLGIDPVTANESGIWNATLPSGVQSWQITMITYDSSTHQTSEFSPIATLFLPLMVKP